MKDDYSVVKEVIASVAKMTGRSANDITLVAVTKGISWNQCSWLYDLGQRHFGENRIAEASAKMDAAPNDCLWHFIGTLQSNKVRKIIGKFSLIHSVDSFELAEKISQCSLEQNIITKILLQANTSGEASKHGLSPEKWKRSYEKLLSLNGLIIQGLMTMAPATNDENAIHQCFASLRHLRDDLQTYTSKNAPMSDLSMGMSNDFKIAIAEGATIVRIGSAINA